MVRHKSEVGKVINVGVAMLIALLSEDDVPLSRWDIITTIMCIVAYHTVRILVKNIPFFQVEPPRSMRLHAQKKNGVL